MDINKCFRSIAKKVRFCHLTELQSEYIQYAVIRDVLICNISAVSGVSFDAVLQYEECVGQQATIERLKYVYEFVCAGGILSYATPKGGE